MHAPEGLLVSPLWIPENSFEQTYYAWEATVNGAASAIPYLQQETALDLSPMSIELALLLDPASSCYFLNAIGGLSAPYWRTDLESRFSENLSANKKILAWIESVIFQIAVNLELMNRLGKVNKIIISGGLSNANGVCQKIADLSQAAVYRSDNSDATLQGIACMATGLSSRWRPQVNEEVFVPKENPSLVRRFSEWKAAMTNWLSE